MTRSSRHRMNRNALRVVAFILAKTPSRPDRLSAEGMGQLLTDRVPARLLAEMREEGFNASLVAEIVNRFLDAKFNAKVREWDSRIEQLRSVSPASVCEWCGSAYQAAVAERNRVGAMARVA